MYKNLTYLSVVKNTVEITFLRSVFFAGTSFMKHPKIIIQSFYSLELKMAILSLKKVLKGRIITLETNKC